MHSTTLITAAVLLTIGIPTANAGTGIEIGQNFTCPAIITDALKGLCDNFNLGTGIETFLDGIAIETGQETCLATFTTCADPILTKLSVCTTTDCQCPLIELFNGECVPSETCEGVNTDQTDALKDMCDNFNVVTSTETGQDTCLATFTTCADPILTKLSVCTTAAIASVLLLKYSTVNAFHPRHVKA
jgi:hypothetical protein